MGPYLGRYGAEIRGETGELPEKNFPPTKVDGKAKPVYRERGYFRGKGFLLSLKPQM